jgi:hypothetical protein
MVPDGIPPGYGEGAIRLPYCGDPINGKRAGMFNIAVHPNGGRVAGQPLAIVEADAAPQGNLDVRRGT